MKEELTVKELLAMFKEWETREKNQIYSINICSDGSCSVDDFGGNYIKDFDNIEELVELLQPEEKDPLQNVVELLETAIEELKKQK